MTWYAILRKDGNLINFWEANSPEEALQDKLAHTPQEGLDGMQAHGWLPLQVRPAQEDELYQVEYGSKWQMEYHLKFQKAWRREKGLPTTSECIRRWKPGDKVAEDGYLEKAYCIREEPGKNAFILSTSGGFIPLAIVGTPIIV